MEKKNVRGVTASDYLLAFVAVIFFAFFLQKLLPRLRFWIDDTSAIIFMLAFLVFIIKPLYKFVRYRKAT
ncbi:MAG: hypothetical protein AABX08_00570 [Nanoarchaeota archaeon]